MRRTGTRAVVPISLTGTGLTMQSVSPISIKGSTDVGIQAAWNLNLKTGLDTGVQAGGTLNLHGSFLNATAAGSLGVQAGGLLDVKGAIVRINGPSCLPAVRVTDPIAGSAATDGSVTGAITGPGATTVCIGG